MATRRPNVPRATPAAAKRRGPQAWGQQTTAAKSSRRTLAAPAAAAPTPAAPSGAAPASPRAAAPAAGKPAANGSGAASGQRRPANAGLQQHLATTPAAPGRETGNPAGSRTGGKAGGKATGRTAAGGADESLDPVPAKAFSGRLLALGVVMIAITILLAPTVKIFLDKRAEIAALQADIAAKQTKQEDLKRQVSRWQDPNYVKQQARDRINMVMPGETGYWVFGSDLPAAQSSGTAGAASAQDPANLPWVDALWESIRRSATD